MAQPCGNSWSSSNCGCGGSSIIEWRSTGSAFAWRGSGWGHYVGAAELLRFLADNGYPLADIERVILGEQTADALYDSLTEQSEPAEDD